MPESAAASFAGVAMLAAEHLDRCRLPIASDIAAALRSAAAAPARESGFALGWFPPASAELQAQLDSFFGDPPPVSPQALGMFAAAAAVHPDLPWRSAGGGKSPHLGATEILGPDGALPCASMRAGFYFQPSRFFYRRHMHAAEEIYMPICGKAEWFADGTPPHAAEPLSFIRHAPDQPHACRTGDSPLFAFWGWRGDIRMETYRYCEENSAESVGA